MNLLKTIETHNEKQSRITGIMAELNSVIQKGTADHFIDWHNSRVTKDKYISPSWYEQYRKEFGE